MTVAVTGQASPSINCSGDWTAETGGALSNAIVELSGSKDETDTGRYRELIYSSVGSDTFFGPKSVIIQ